MPDRDGPMRGGRAHRCIPTIEGLEGRIVPTVAGASAQASRIALVRREELRYTSYVQGLELRSQATPAEYLALRDDARTISSHASTTTLDPATADAKALAVSLQLDRAALDGWMGESAWADVAGRLQKNLDGLNVSRSVVDQTLSDMRAIAASAGVTFSEFQEFTNRFNALRNGEQNLYSNQSRYRFDDPALFYTQHLRGFFRGGAVNTTKDRARLSSDIASITSASGAAPADIATLRSDISLMEKIEAGLTSGGSRQLGDAYVAAFADGIPDSAALAQLSTEFATVLGDGGSPAMHENAARLVADAPAFGRAAGGSQANVRTLVDDVNAVVADGVGSSLNPFKVVIRRGQG
jgi:hypothetical protein